MARDMTLFDGCVLIEGGPFWFINDDGEAVMAPASLILTDGLFGAKVVGVGTGRQFGPDEIALTRGDAVASAIARLESMCSTRREALARDEARLKRLYAQRAEAKEWFAGVVPGVEVPA